MAAGRRETRKEEMRARLLAAALELFALRGFETTTIDDIAQRADVARQTVLNHYPHKRDFLQAWGQGRRDVLTAADEQHAPDEPVRARLHRVYATLAQINEDERELTRMLHVSLDHGEVLSHQRPVPEAVRATIQAGQARGELSPSADAQAAAEVLTAVYFDTLSRWLTEGDAPFDLTRSLSTRLDLVLDGLALVSAAS